MRVLLTGASGFLGNHLVRHLASQGYEITAVVRSSTQLDTLVSVQRHYPENLSLHRLDGDPIEDLFRTVSFDAIIHTATAYGRGRDSTADILNANLILPLDLLEHASNSSVPLFINTDSFFTKSPRGYRHLVHYSQSKRTLREWIEWIRPQTTVLNLRLEHVYGPDDNPEKFVPSALRAIAIDRRPAFKMTYGHQRRDFIYVDDVIRAYQVCLSQATALLPNRIYDFEVGTGTSTEVRNLPLVMKELSKSPTDLEFGAIPYRSDEIMESRANSDFAEKFDWSPRVDLGDGIARLVSASGAQPNSGPGANDKEHGSRTF